MNDLLFDIPKVLSPKLTWLKAHSVGTCYRQGLDDGPWFAHCGIDPLEYVDNHLEWPDAHFFACGETEDEAIFALALKRNWKLWNEDPQTALNGIAQKPRGKWAMSNDGKTMKWMDDV